MNMTDFKRRYVMITRMFYRDMCMLGLCYLKLVNLVKLVNGKELLTLL